MGMLEYYSFFYMGIWLSGHTVGSNEEDAKVPGTVAEQLVGMGNCTSTKEGSKDYREGGAGGLSTPVVESHLGRGSGSCSGRCGRGSFHNGERI